MKNYRNLKCNYLLVLLASVLIGGSAYAEINLPTAVLFEKSIYFQKPGGQPVQLKPGIYEVENIGEKQMEIDPIGEGSSVTVQALAGGHDVDIEEPKALLTPPPDNNDDRIHLVLWLPEGLALEAIGSYSGVFSRSLMSWGTEDDGKDTVSSNQQIVKLEKSIFFKTIDGSPKLIQPGEYTVANADDGLQLAPADQSADAVMIKTDSLGSTAVFLLPDFNDDPNYQLLLLGTAEGEVLVAVGSHSGTFPRGWTNWVKKKIKKTTYNAYKHVKKHGRKYTRIAYKHGKNALKKACGSFEKGVRCVQIALKAAGAG